MAFAAKAHPALDIVNVKSHSSTLPTAQVEIADAKVGPMGKIQCLLQGGKEGLIDIIENTGHLSVHLAVGF